jgi:CubicO group peptidase (beta-lactamase class C family)
MRYFVRKKIRYGYLAGVMMLLLLISGRSSRDIPSVGQIIKLQKDRERSTVVLNNELQLIPLKSLKGRKIASVNTGSSHASIFDSLLRKYADVTSFTFYPGQETSVDEDISGFNTIIIQVTPESLIRPGTMNFIRETRLSKEIIIAGFGNTGYLQKLNEITAPIIWSTEQTAGSANYSAQVLFGGISATSRLTDSISPRYASGAGYSTEKIRLKYTIPEEVGINSYNLNKIDDIVEEAISEHATPGAVVMVVKDGDVIFNKAYGTHTYEDNVSTRVDDIFDLASVTKIAATTITAMSLYDQKKLDLNAPISTYLSDTRGTNKAGIRVREAMLHQAGFINLDFLSKVKSQDHSSDSSWLYPVKVADNYYLRRNFYHDVMWQAMLKSPVPTRGKYVYSDISMYVMKEIIEHQSGTTLDHYVSEEFYKPLGMTRAGFNPLKRFEKDEIVPTERDNYFRKELLQGYVHDQGAALANGVSGHAGLFSTANDLAILNQMLLNRGFYGGSQYFKPETVDLFTSRQSTVSQRGLGFDRWDPKSNSGYPSKLASSETYGHTGFTGTCVWVDPKYNLIYIFLSNRIYPSSSSKLNSLRIRPRIQDVIYEAIQNGGTSAATASHS